MKWLSLCLIVLLMLLVGSAGILVAQDDWDKGENRIPNSDFEVDSNGAQPTGWTLEDGT